MVYSGFKEQFGGITTDANIQLKAWTERTILAQVKAKTVFKATFHLDT